MERPGVTIPIVVVEGLVKRYQKADRNAVDGISFRVQPGELFALLGPIGVIVGVSISRGQLLALVPVAIISCLLGASFGILVLSNLSSRRLANHDGADAKPYQESQLRRLVAPSATYRQGNNHD